MKKIAIFFFLYFLLCQQLACSQSKQNLSPMSEIDSLKLILKTAEEDINMVNILCRLSEICSEEDILIYARRALKLSEKLNYKKGIASALGNIGFAYNNKGEIIKALEFDFKALELQEEIGDKFGLAGSLNNIGLIYKNQGHIEKALEYDVKALKLHEEIGDKLGIALSLNNIGAIYNNQNKIKEALEYYTRAYKIREEIGDRYGIAQSLNNFGVIYDKKMKREKALEYFFRALKIDEEIGDKKNIANALNNIGFVYKEEGMLDKALEYSLKSLEIWKEINDKSGVAHALNNIGNIYLDQKRFKQAENFCQSALKISKELGFPEMIKNASGSLSKIYYQLNRNKEAYEMHVLFKNMSDSLSNIQSQRAIIERQMNYEFEKKETSIKLDHVKKEVLFTAEINQKKILIYSVLLIVVLLLVLFVFVIKSNFQKNKTNSLLHEQKLIIEKEQKEILDSIHYAKRIQSALFANKDLVDSRIPHNFVLFKPKDIVSGDFYWSTEHKNKFYLAICDSTGHGVPGAFMSLLNMGFLSEAINEKNITEPNDVFNYVRRRLINSISKDGQQDGFDGVLLCYDNETNKLTYAAANSSPILISNSELISLKTDKMPVGKGIKESPFSLFNIAIKPNDTLYLYSDGYPDQFGGPQGKKFMYKQLKELLISIAHLPMQEQKEKLASTFNNWKGNLEQVDDVTIVGVKI